jgi:hypothetical protein
MPDINDLSIEQIEKVLKLRKELEAVFAKPAAKLGKKLAAKADEAPTKKPKKKMTKAARDAISAAKTKWWADKHKADKKAGK